MDTFKNPIEPNKFRKTNSIWNMLGLNSPKVIGMVSDLINQRSFSKKEDWENYYYEYGRSKEYLRKVAKKLYENLPDNLDLSLDDCFNCVWYRIIGETWNGIIFREKNTVNQLSKIYNNIFKFKKTNDRLDNNYAVDYEVYYNNELICGLQIKPTSYNESNANYIMQAKKTNLEKNLKYIEIYNVPVITITSDIYGNITSNDTIQELHELYIKYQ